MIDIFRIVKDEKKIHGKIVKSFLKNFYTDEWFPLKVLKKYFQNNPKFIIFPSGLSHL